MAATTKRNWKLQEFVAHAGNVNCLALGHKSGRVMVTGGEDKKVNMWAVGKPNCIMSLSGHTSAVEAVRFGNAEEMVVAGSMSGALKIWDLEAAKIVRTLTGHKSNIRSLDFHPYGDFVASGSLDTNIKLWDIRRKGCIFTYKGHTNCINCLRFSPDGRWISSAGEDGLVKVWDLTAGKLLQDLKAHTGPVNTLEFHPNEFLLASGSKDRTVKFWDLETFQPVCSTDGECGGPVKSIFFHPDGVCIYAAIDDMLKVYGWEPARCYDTLSTSWGKVADISIASNQLIGASFSQTNVSTFVVDLQRVQPLGGMPSEAQEPPPQQRLSSSSGRKSFVTERPPTQSTKQAKYGNNNANECAPKEEPDEPAAATEDPGDDAASVADIRDPEDYQQIFHPKHRLARDNNTHSPTRHADPFPAPPDDGIPEKDYPKPKKASPEQMPEPVKAQPLKPSSQPPKPSSQPPKAPVQQPAQAKPPPSAKTQVKPQSTVVPSDRNKPAGLEFEDFLPKQACPAVSEQGIPPNISEAEALSSIVKGHDSMLAVMASRQKNLSILRALWTGGNTKTAIDSAVNMNDLAVIVDLLNVLCAKKSLWDLDVCMAMLPELKNLLISKYESYVHVGCSALKLILKNFGPMIKENVSAPSGIGVDITREERMRKCRSCYNHLMSLGSILDSKSTVSGKLGSTFRELQILMSTLN